MTYQLAEDGIAKIASPTLENYNIFLVALIARLKRVEKRFFLYLGLFIRPR